VKIQTVFVYEPLLRSIYHDLANLAEALATLIGRPAPYHHNAAAGLGQGWLRVVVLCTALRCIGRFFILQIINHYRDEITRRVHQIAVGPSED